MDRQMGPNKGLFPSSHTFMITKYCRSSTGGCARSTKSIKRTVQEIPSLDTVIMVIGTLFSFYSIAAWITRRRIAE